MSFLCPDLSLNVERVAFLTKRTNIHSLRERIHQRGLRTAKSEPRRRFVRMKSTGTSRQDPNDEPRGANCGRIIAWSHRHGLAS